MPEHFDNVGDCVEATLARVGKRIVMALPLALGKPVPLVNEFFRRALHDPSIELEILTGLSLRLPAPASELERRFLEPFVERVFGDYPALDYVTAARAGKMPANVAVIEFFLEPGAYLDVSSAQQHYLSANYTHVAREVLARGVNVLAQLVAKRQRAGRAEISLSCNPDVTVDLLPELELRRRAGHEIVTIGEVNRKLPFMPGDAVVAADVFDHLVEHPRYDFELYCPPNPAISTAEYLLGLHASALVRDGGTLQVGIGELGDAIVYCLQLRHQHNGVWRQALSDCGATRRFAGAIEAIGGTQAFARGLYGCTEMFVDGFLDLYRSGILKRRVYPHLQVQQLLDAGTIDEKLDARILDRLIDAGLPRCLDAEAFAALRAVGVLHQDCRYADDRIGTPRGEWLRADLADPALRARIASECLGSRLQNGALLHGGFLFGPRAFYAALRDLPEAERALFQMTGVGFINQIIGRDLELRVAQRQHARFINTAMMATLLGAAIADGLDDGRVVSGVGGQYNFVAMAHALPGARSILCVRSTRTKHGRTTSNLVWSYGHTTIPRHLRDVVVTEYGIADLRGKTDSEVIAALLAIADSRFQAQLMRQAQAAGKLPREHRILDQHRNNTPAALERALAQHRHAGRFAEYPFGTDFTAEEMVLQKALRRLRERMRTPWGKARTVSLAVVQAAAAKELRPCLERMALERPHGAREWLLQKLLLAALREVVA
ncbi:MAG: acetyl-CoA hydrolase/transferase C-terminal domain-containing protein [Planctomycetota bacterium]